jgi:DNA-binding IclR family transcriptional regulator
MTSSRNRAISILELLAHHPFGLKSNDIAGRLDIPVAATRRLLRELDESGYLHGGAKNDLFRLGAKLPAIGLSFLGASGVTDLVQPILDDLAKRTGELVRLAIVENDSLTWAAKSQGARSGLLYLPDPNADVYLPATASGQAWLSCLSERHLRVVIEKCGFNYREVCPNVPSGMEALLEFLTTARNKGYASASETYEVGTSEIAAPIRRGNSTDPVGTVSVAGPSIRLTPVRMLEIAPWLLASAAELGAAASSSPLFNGA